MHFSQSVLSTLRIFSCVPRLGISKANPQFCACETEIVFDRPAVIKEVGDEGAIPGSCAAANVRRLAEVERMSVGDVGNFAGVVAEGEPAVDVALKSGGWTRCRKVMLLDDSGVLVELTVWGDLALDGWTPGSVVLLKGVKASDWSGRSLSTMSTTTVVFARSGVALQGRAEALRLWCVIHGAEALVRARRLTVNPRSMAQAVCIAEVLAAGQTRSVMEAVVDHVTVVCVVGKGKGFYDACVAGAGDGLTRSCGRKAEWLGEGRGWRCAGGHVCGEAKKRWVVPFEIVDHSGSMQVTAFDDVAGTILGCRFALFLFPFLFLSLSFSLFLSPWY